MKNKIKLRSLDEIFLGVQWISHSERLRDPKKMINVDTIDKGQLIINYES